MVWQFQHYKDGSERKNLRFSTRQPAHQAEEKKVAAARGLSAQCSAATEFSASLLGSLLRVPMARCPGPWFSWTGIWAKLNERNDLEKVYLLVDFFV